MRAEKGEEIWEICAEQTVSLIERVISVIRKTEDFSPTNRKSRNILENVKLLNYFETHRIVEDIQKTIKFVGEQAGTEIQYQHCNKCEGERSNVLCLVLFPLLKSLYESYNLIDDSIQQDMSSKKDISRSRDTRPPPPRGMLSIQNYTDIAAILEFTVCTSLVPCIDDNILTPIQERAQYLLPKSIAGRLPRLSLLWGTATLKHGSVQSTEQRIVELDTSLSLIGELVLLDRFRPMLLPRHLADLYAGLFQMEYLKETYLQAGNKISIRKNIVARSGRLFNDVDYLNQARAYQSLLLRGLKTPIWIRKRVSNLLANLAVQDIRAIVQIWVNAASSSQEDMTAAALRLATVLVSSNDEVYFIKLCRQLVGLLDCDNQHMGQENFAFSLTVWAFVEFLPNKNQKTVFLEVISDGLFNEIGSDSMGRCLRRIIALLSAIPIPSHKTNSICMMLLSEIPKEPEKNMFNAILQIATTFTIEENKLKPDAIFALRLACIAIEHATFSESTLIEGPNLLSLVLLRSILPTQNALMSQTSNESIVHYIEKRAKVLIDNVLLPMEKHQQDPNVHIGSNLLHILFHHMLLIIFEVAHLGDQFFDVRPAVVVMLPMLCDKCPEERLLLGTATDSTGMLETFNVILNCAAAFVDHSYDQRAEKNTSEAVYNLVLANNLLCNFAASNTLSKAKENVTDYPFLNEILLPTTSIILSLLIAILELGSKQRNKHELDSLKASLPALQILSSPKVQYEQEDADCKRLHAEIAEMASYAALLVVACISKTERVQTVHEARKKRSLESIIEEAEKNISSNHPAFRAEGAAQLRLLAIGCLQERGEKLPRRVLIQEASEPLSTVANVDFLEDILRLAISTLSDPESYVYMAGIQTVAAIADLKPQTIIPIVSLTISTGNLKLGVSSQKVQIPENDRIKLAEALLCIVRRRGAAIHQNTTQLLRMMIYGNQQVDHKASRNYTSEIQEETHQYFLECADVTSDLTDGLDDMEQKKFLANTGGPLFEVELNAVLRSSCIMIVAEIVNVAFPNIIASHVNELVGLVTRALHLEKSRPVRRAVAFLSASLYNAAIREAQGEFDTTSLLVEMVASREVEMESALVSSLSNDSDPSLRARCEEALEARSQLAETGAFSLAALYLEEQQLENQSPAVTILKKRLGKHQN